MRKLLLSAVWAAGLAMLSGGVLHGQSISGKIDESIQRLKTMNTASERTKEYQKIIGMIKKEHQLSGRSEVVEHQRDLTEAMRIIKKEAEANKPVLENNLLALLLDDIMLRRIGLFLADYLVSPEKVDDAEFEVALVSLGEYIKREESDHLGNLKNNEIIDSILEFNIYSTDHPVLESDQVKELLRKYKEIDPIFAQQLSEYIGVAQLATANYESDKDADAYASEMQKAVENHLSVAMNEGGVAQFDKQIKNIESIDSVEGKMLDKEQDDVTFTLDQVGAQALPQDIKGLLQTVLTQAKEIIQALKSAGEDDEEDIQLARGLQLSTEYLSTLLMEQLKISKASAQAEARYIVGPEVYDSLDVFADSIEKYLKYDELQEKVKQSLKNALKKIEALQEKLESNYENKIKQVKAAKSGETTGFTRYTGAYTDTYFERQFDFIAAQMKGLAAIDPAVESAQSYYQFFNEKDRQKHLFDVAGKATYAGGQGSVINRMYERLENTRAIVAKHIEKQLQEKMDVDISAVVDDISAGREQIKDEVKGSLEALTATQREKEVAAQRKAEQEEREQQEQLRQEEERIKAEQERREVERKAQLAREAAERKEQEKIAAELQERLVAEQQERDRRFALELQRLQEEEAKAERLQAEQERLERERREAERKAQLAREAEKRKAEQERAAQLKAEQERLAAEQARMEREKREETARLKAEQERLERERHEAEEAARLAALQQQQPDVTPTPPLPSGEPVGPGVKSVLSVNPTTVTVGVILALVAFGVYAKYKVAISPEQQLKKQAALKPVDFKADAVRTQQMAKGLAKSYSDMAQDAHLDQAVKDRAQSIARDLGNLAKGPVDQQLAQSLVKDIQELEAMQRKTQTASWITGMRRLVAA